MPADITINLEQEVRLINGYDVGVDGAVSVVGHHGEVVEQLGRGDQNVGGIPLDRTD